MMGDYGTTAAAVVVFAGMVPPGTSSMYVIGVDGRLYERLWHADSDSWQWRPHGHPISTTLQSVKPPTTAAKRTVKRKTLRTPGHKLLPARPVVVSEHIVVCLLLSGQQAARVVKGNSWDWEVSRVY